MLLEGLECVSVACSHASLASSLLALTDPSLGWAGGWGALPSHFSGALLSCCRPFHARFVRTLPSSS